jgi:hypothetical protein
MKREEVVNGKAPKYDGPRIRVVALRLLLWTTLGEASPLMATTALMNG